MKTKLGLIIKALVEPVRPRQKFNLVYQVARVLILFYARVLLRMDILKHEALPEGPKIFVANHPNISDPFLIHLLGRLNVMVIGKAFGTPVTGYLLHKVGEIPVYPGGDALAQAIKRLQAGHSIGIFPEGRESPEHGIAKGRSGAARMALSTGAYVIPVGIHLDRKRLKAINFKISGERLPSHIYLRGPYMVTVGKAVRFSGDPEDRALVSEVTEVIMDQIKTLAYESEVRMEDQAHLPQGVLQMLKRIFSFKYLGMI